MEILCFSANVRQYNIAYTLMMASAQVVETSVNTNNSPSQDYTTNPDDHSNHNIAYSVVHAQVCF